jgi:hypothetical protein
MACARAELPTKSGIGGRDAKMSDENDKTTIP